jgi:ATP-dependent exoDNAse (exonuclease V) beta subunit
LHEVPYSLVTDDGGGSGRGQNRIESGIIDALYLRDGGSANGAWTIVEFKTDHVRDAAALERLLVEADYLAQTERYVAAVERLLRSRPAAILCLLDYAGGVHLQLVSIHSLSVLTCRA